MFLSREYCFKCHEDTDFHNGKCSKCTFNEKEERIRNWEAMPTRKKLSDIRERLEKLERGSARY